MYGQAYDIYDYAEDKHTTKYWDLAHVDVAFTDESYTVTVIIDHSHGYAGFESALGRDVMLGPGAWAGLMFTFRHQSEHTFKGEHFDLEM